MNIILNTITQSNKPVLNSPILLINIGQSNNAGVVSPEFTEPVGYIEDNQPNYMGRKTGVNSLTNVSLPIPPGQNHTFQNISLGHNIDTQNYDDPIDRTALFPPLYISAIELNSYYNIPVYCVNTVRGGSTLAFKITGMTWNSNASVPDEYSLYRLSKQYIDIAIGLMNAEYGAGNWQILYFDWNQGESGPADPIVYEADEFDLFNGFFNSYSSYDFKIVSTGVKKLPDINQAKINNSNKSSRIIYSDNDDLIYGNDNTHYTPESHFNRGIKTANIIKSMYKI